MNMILMLTDSLHIVEYNKDLVGTISLHIRIHIEHILPIFCKMNIFELHPHKMDECRPDFIARVCLYGKQNSM